MPGPAAAGPVPPRWRRWPCPRGLTGRLGAAAACRCSGLLLVCCSSWSPCACFLVLAVSPRLFDQGPQWFTLTYLRQAFTGATAVAIVNSLWVSSAAAALGLAHRLPDRLAGQPHHAAGPAAGVRRHVAGAAAAVLAAGARLGAAGPAGRRDVPARARLAVGHPRDHGPVRRGAAARPALRPVHLPGDHGRRWPGWARSSRTPPGCTAPAAPPGDAARHARSWRRPSGPRWPSGSPSRSATSAWPPRWPTTRTSPWPPTSSTRPSTTSRRASRSPRRMGWLLVAPVAIPLALQARALRGRSYAVLSGRTRQAVRRQLAAARPSRLAAGRRRCSTWSRSASPASARSAARCWPTTAARSRSPWSTTARCSTSPALIGPLERSLVYGVITASVTVVGGLHRRPAAGAAADPRSTRLLDFLLLAAVALPSVVFAAGYIFAYNLPFFSRLGINLYQTTTLLVIAYVASSLPTNARVLVGAVSQLQPSLQDAARAHGAGRVAAWVRGVSAGRVPAAGDGLAAHLLRRVPGAADLPAALRAGLAARSRSPSRTTSATTTSASAWPRRCWPSPSRWPSVGDRARRLPAARAGRLAPDRSGGPWLSSIVDRAASSKVYPGGNRALRDVSLRRRARHLPGPARARRGRARPPCCAAWPASSGSRSGRIAIGDRVVADGRIHLPPERRDLSMVFQDYALWPHLRRATTSPSPCAAAGWPGPSAGTRPRRCSSASAWRAGRAVPERAVRRRAAAGRAGPRPGRRHRPAALRRAAVQPRRRPARADAGGDLLAGPRGRAPPPSTSPTTRSRRSHWPTRSASSSRGGWSSSARPRRSTPPRHAVRGPLHRPGRRAARARPPPAGRTARSWSKRRPAAARPGRSGPAATRAGPHRRGRRLLMIRPTGVQTVRHGTAGPERHLAGRSPTSPSAAGATSTRSTSAPAPGSPASSPMSGPPGVRPSACAWTRRAATSSRPSHKATHPGSSRRRR